MGTRGRDRACGLCAIAAARRSFADVTRMKPVPSEFVPDQEMDAFVDGKTV